MSETRRQRLAMAALALAGTENGKIEFEEAVTRAAASWATPCEQRHLDVLALPTRTSSGSVKRSL